MIWILLPAYNEEPSFPPLTAKIRESMEKIGARYRIVVVNDGSRDRSASVLDDIAKTTPVEVLTHKYNRGLGETIRDGLEYIAEHSAPEDVVVRMDCDDTHEPEYIAKMIAKLNEGYEVVIASRYQPGGGVIGLDWYRRSISRTANLMLKAWFPMPHIWEYTCGYRAYRASLIKDLLEIFGNKLIDLKGLGFTGTIEKLVKCRMVRARVVEIPFMLHYHQKRSVSKVVTSITTLGYLVLMAKYMTWWGDEGQQWRTACEARAHRMAESTLPPVSTS
jgi:dolichol-phosphate mannosyltransferase